MPFTEQLKKDVRNKAHQRCCICHAWDIEVHHIIPQEGGGPDTEDNAAPLCGKCHNQFGGNPDKRKAIRETRDLWYDLCAKRYAPDGGQLDEIKNDLAQVKNTNERLLHAVTEALRLRDLEDKLSPDEKAEIDQLVKVMFNAHVETEYTGSKYMEWLREVDPGDARWVLLGAKHDIQLLKTLVVMKSLHIDVVQSGEQEVTNHVHGIDIDKLEKVFWQFVEICGMPEELIEGFRDDIQAIRQDRTKEDILSNKIRSSFTFNSCTAFADFTRGVTLENTSGIPVTVRSVELLAKTTEGHLLSIDFSPDTSKSPKGTEISQRGWVVLPVETKACWIAPVGDHLKELGRFTISGSKVTVEYESPTGEPRLLEIEAEGRDASAICDLFQGYYDQLSEL